MYVCSLKKSSKIRPTRDFDVCYDSTLTFPTSKDYKREISKALTETSTFVIRPHYNAMFSDTRCRQVLVPQRPVLPEHIGKVLSAQISIEIPTSKLLGAKRSLFFRQPVPKARLAIKEQKESRAEITVDLHVDLSKDGTMSKSTQTDYRDSETQTESWPHDIVALHGTRFLELNWSEIGKPVGWRDIEFIERTWQRQAWDAMLPDLRSVNPQHLLAVTSCLIANDNAYTERNLDAVNDRRMQLSEDYLTRSLATDRRKLCSRLQRLSNLLKENSQKKLDYMKHKLLRCMRKVDMEHRKIDRKYKSRGVLADLSDKGSELYAPQLRFGENPARRNEKFNHKLLERCSGLEILEKRLVQSVRLPPAFQSNGSLKSLKLSGNCNRAVKLCQKGLEALYMDLKAMPAKSGENQQPTVGILQLRETETVETPANVEIIHTTEEDNQNTLLLKKVIEGRAIQTQTMGHLPESSLFDDDVDSLV